MVLCNSAAYLIALGSYDEACTHAREALRLGQRVGNQRVICWALEHLAAVAASRRREENDTGDLRRAAQVIGFVESLSEYLGSTRQLSFEKQEYDELLGALRDAFGEEELAKLLVEGKVWSEDRAIAEALEI